MWALALLATAASDWPDAARHWRKVAGKANAHIAPPTVVWGGDESYAQADHRMLSWRQVGMAALKAVAA